MLDKYKNMIIESTKDIYWLVLSFCILWLTLFITWLLYYFIKMFRQLSSITTKVEETVSMIHGMVKAVHSRSENLVSYVAGILKSSNQLKELFGKQDKKSDRQRSKK